MHCSHSKHHADTIAMYGGVLPYRIRILTELVYGDASDNKEVWLQHYRAHNERVKAVCIMVNYEACTITFMLDHTC